MIQERTVFRNIGFTWSLLWILDSPVLPGLVFLRIVGLGSSFGYWCSYESINLNYSKHIVKISTLQANKRLIYKLQKLPTQ
jgi:hypothetical protein